ncbi:MAG TPA: DUF763 domain-containing protein [Anaeromyxobacteraceae bacterium]
MPRTVSGLAPRARAGGSPGGARAGTADLPLHGGTVPPWLRDRMARLGRVLVEAIVLEYGRQELVRRLAHPFWFQSLGCLMGMDWHSSGITTSVLGALKRGLEPVEWELGVHVCGGRGRHSRRTPGELSAVGERTGLDGPALADTSRLVAKVDTAAVQDGYDLYLHAFVVTDDGAWAVVQQGMNTGTRRARRYHWLSEGVTSFVDAPHAAIEGTPGGAIVNLTDHRAAAARRAQVELVAAGPDRVVAEVTRLRDAPIPALDLPGHHDVRPTDVLLRRLHGAMAATEARGPRDFQELLLVPGVGARTVLALALAAEVIHGAPCRFSDPARFSLAHGGKDGHPFPVPLRVYDRTLHVLRQAVDRARLGKDDRLAAIRQLDAEARRLEAAASGEGLERFMEREREESSRYGGKSVFGSATPSAAPTPSATPTSAQLRLFR